MIKLVVAREYEYTLKAEKGKENPTIFKLKTLTPEDMVKIDDISFDYNGQGGVSKIKLGSSILKRVELGIIGWNLKEECTVENKRRLPIIVIKELSSELIETSSIKEEEIKN